MDLTRRSNRSVYRGAKCTDYFFSYTCPSFTATTLVKLWILLPTNASFRSPLDSYRAVVAHCRAGPVKIYKLQNVLRCYCVVKIQVFYRNNCNILHYFLFLILNPIIIVDGRQGIKCYQMLFEIPFDKSRELGQGFWWEWW